MIVPYISGLELALWTQARESRAARASLGGLAASRRRAANADEINSLTDWRRWA
jgi:hypothetical protein